MNSEDHSFFNTPRYKLTLCLAISVFFYLFIIFFLPFGVDNYDPEHQYTPNFLLEISYFAIVLFAFSLFNEFTLKPLFIREANWKNILLWTAWALIFLGSAIFITYNILGAWHDFSFESYPRFVFECSGILIFPFTAVFFIFRYRSVQKQMQSLIINSGSKLPTQQLLTFKGAGSKDLITLSLSSFLYGKAQDNYVELYYLENNAEKKFVMRATLNNLVSSVASDGISRCHRSFMVNLYQVRNIKGTDQDFTLYLTPFDTPVPVSRSYAKATLESLRKLNILA